MTKDRDRNDLGPPAPPPEPDATSLETLPKGQRDFIDLNNEIAGRDTGRLKRFLSGDAQSFSSEGKRQEKKFTELLRLLQDAEYARAFYAAQLFAERAHTAMTRALERNATESVEASRRLERLKDSAAELPNGMKIFRSRDGRVFAEDGLEIRDPSRVQNLKASPSWKEFREAREEAERLERERRAIEDYGRETLDPIRRRLADGNNPYRKDELAQLAREAEEKMPDRMREILAESKPQTSVRPAAESAAATDFFGSAGLNAPALKGDFSAAHDAAPVSTAGDPAPGPLPKNTR